MLGFSLISKMLEGSADPELLKDIQIIFPNLIMPNLTPLINICDYLNGGPPRRSRACVELLKAVPRRQR